MQDDGFTGTRPTSGDLLTDVKLRRWSLAFADAELERRFRAFHAATHLVRARQAVLLAAGLFLLFAILDHLLFPQVAPSIFRVRLLVVAVLLVCYLLLLRSGSGGHLQGVLATVYIAACIGLTCLFAILPAGGIQTYYVGMLLAVIWAFNVSGMLFRNAAWSSVVACVAYEILLYLYQPMPGGQVVGSLFFLGSTLLLCGWGGYVQERLFRHSFLQMLVIDRQRRENEAMARIDLLTGIGNRRCCLDHLRRHLAEKRRSKGRFAIFFVDLDAFKQVNDTYGHEAGDALLVETARRLLGLLRESDGVYRFGGDEFVVLLTNVHDRRDVEVVAAKMVQALAEPVAYQGHRLRAGASVGIALYPEHGETVEELLHRADQAMYRAKSASGSSYRLAG